MLLVNQSSYDVFAFVRVLKRIRLHQQFFALFLLEYTHPSIDNGSLLDLEKILLLHVLPMFFGLADVCVP